MFPRIQDRLRAAVSPAGKRSFLLQLGRRARLLDVGCGNDAPIYCKRLRPDLHYIGLDIDDYNQSERSKMLADEYILVRPERFAQAIESLQGSVDAVISSHNLEHCAEPERVLDAMCRAVAPGGVLFLSFPSAASVEFPSRGGTLNFYDDSTHRNLIDWERTLAKLCAHGFNMARSHRRYRPPVLYVIGAACEPFSRARRKVLPGTWAYWGFESIIWASKRSSS